MAKVGRYLKAYPIARFREFSGWTENAQNARPEDQNGEGPEAAAPRPLTDSDFLYLQEDYTVTDGIFLDQNIIFDQVTPEWIEFCENTLKFEIPEYQRTPPAEQSQA
jgi:hypothetical protein